MKRVLWIALLSSAAFGQSPDNSLAFDFADVHVSPPSTNPTMRGGALRGVRYDVRTATMVDLISTAYGMETNKVLGGPRWLDWDRFDVFAKTSEATTWANLKMMLQNLLADRFKLVVHKDSRPMPAFALTVGKGKPKMKEASGSGESGCRGVEQNPAPGTVEYEMVSCHNVTMTVFVELLRGYAEGVGGNYLPDPVVDETGLGGKWDFDLKWTERRRLAQAGPDGISLFDAVDKQLGLKLEAKKIPLPVLIVDSVNQTPTPNDPEIAKKIPPPPPTEFEVATIKPSAPDSRGGGSIQNGRIDLRNATLKQLIQFAWELEGHDEMVVGLPKSSESTRYDLLAKVAISGTIKSEDIGIDALRVMLRNLLVERFGLKAHMEDRPLSAYTMTATKQTKVQKADPQNRTSCKSGAGATPILNRLITCQNMSMSQFAAILQRMAGGYVRLPIRDATGIEGYWDFSVNFSGVNLLPGGIFDPNANSATPDPSGSMTLPEALQKQLGLRLEMEKRPIPVLVVDHVEDKPTEN